jgi:hypothetical protein
LLHSNSFFTYTSVYCVCVCVCVCVEGGGIIFYYVVLH